MARNKRSIKGMGKTNGRLKRFIKTVIVSATTSFAVATWAINLHVLDDININSLVAWLDVDRLLGQRQSVQQAQHDDYVQTSFAQCRQFFPD